MSKYGLIFVLLGVGFIGLSIYAVFTGDLIGGGKYSPMTINREESPKGFWLFVVFYMVLAGYFLLGALRDIKDGE